MSHRPSWKCNLTAVDTLSINLNSGLITDTEVAFTLSFVQHSLLKLGGKEQKLHWQKYKGMTTAILFMNPTSLYLSTAV